MSSLLYATWLLDAVLLRANLVRRHGSLSPFPYNLFPEGGEDSGRLGVDAGKSTFLMLDEL